MKVKENTKQTSLIRFQIRIVMKLRRDGDIRQAARLLKKFEMKNKSMVSIA